MSSLEDVSQVFFKTSIDGPFVEPSELRSSNLEKLEQQSMYDIWMACYSPSQLEAKIAAQEITTEIVFVGQLPLHYRHLLH